MKRHRSMFDKRGLLAMRAEALSVFFEVESERQDFEQIGDVAIVRIEGPLTQHADWFWDSYDAIKSRVCAALESSATRVVLRIDSPGGDVSGCFETSRELRDLAAAAGKELVAYADGLAASAGYALACAASKIYLPATGFVGSIGVISTLFDAVQFNAKMGLNYEVIASGKRKRYGHPNVPISDAAIANTQQQVDALADLFFELVSESRGIDVASVAGLEAGVLLGQQAVAANLADGVCTFDELLGLLSSGNTEASSGADHEDNMGWKDALKKAADEGDEEAKKALAALDDEEEKKAEDSEKEEKAEDSDSEDKNEKKDDGEEKKDAKSADLAMAASVQSLTAWRAEIEERDERSKLMASRSDLAPEVVSFLDRQPLAVVRDAVKTLPRGAVKAKGQIGAARAALGVVPAEAAKVDDADHLPPDQARDLDIKMGLAKPTQAIRHEGNKLFLGVMTPSEARAELARRNSKSGGAR